jgi:hypothetical protein
MLPWEGVLRGHLRLSRERGLQMSTSGKAARAACVLVFRKEKKGGNKKLEKVGGSAEAEPLYFEELL